MSKLSHGEYKARAAFKKAAYPLIIEELNKEPLNSSQICERIQHSTVVSKLLSQYPHLKEQSGIDRSVKIDKRPKWYQIIRADLQTGEPGYKLLIKNGYMPVGDRKARKWIKKQEDSTPTLDALPVKVEESVKKVMTECEMILQHAESLAKLAPNDKIFANCLKHAKQVYGE